MPRRAFPGGILLCLALLTSAGRAEEGKVELQLLDPERREFAPDETIPLRLVNGSAQPLYLVVERHARVRTEKGAAVPGLPVHERRKRKFFFRSDRWIYTSGGEARFTSAVLRPGDALRFQSRISRTGKYRIHLRYWWLETPEEEKEFLKLDVKTLEEKYNRRARWLDTPTFRIKGLPPPKPAPR